MKCIEINGRVFKKRLCEKIIKNKLVIYVSNGSSIVSEYACDINNKLEIRYITTLMEETKHSTDYTDCFVRTVHRVCKECGIKNVVHLNCLLRHEIKGDEGCLEDYSFGIHTYFKGWVTLSDKLINTEIVKYVLIDNNKRYELEEI